MIQPEIFHPSYSSINAIDFQYFESPGASFDSFISTIFSDEIVDFPTLESIIQTGSSPSTTTPQESLEFEDVCKWYNEINEEGNATPQIIIESNAEGSCVSQQSSAISEMFPDFPGNNSLETSVISGMFPDFPGNGSLETSAISEMCPDFPGNNSMETSEISETFPDFTGNNMDEDDDQRSLCHLLAAYAEAMESGYKVLADIISKHIWEKINPIGKARERVLYHLYKSLENSGDYLREELNKNTEAAHKLIHRCSPYARFVHYTANTAILEATPDGIETVHIVDFDIGDGVQLASLIDAISNKNFALKIISLKLETEINNQSPRNFEGTTIRLYNHAKSYGVKLQIEQVSPDDLETELKRIKKRSKRTDWFAFNCMIGLPHMAKRRHRRQAMKFLNAAKSFLSEYVNHRGILTFGDGDAIHNPKTSSGYASFFDKQLMHYQALFESMESNFPADLAEATIAVESLFLSPYICADSWFQQWKNANESLDLREGDMLEGCKISMESIIEAKEMVNEGKSSYRIKVEGERENEMVLEFKGIPLVRVSSWI